MTIRKGLNTVVVTGLLLIFAGCASVGSHSVSRDRFDYTTAISESWKAQMLINMVKARYGDPPTFLEVASVINQYSLESQLDLRFTWADPVTAAMTNNQSVGGAARYIDRPTITYSPMTGERFARSMMTPIPPAAILSFIQANYPVDLVFRLCVHSINGIRNGFGGAVRARPADPEFYALIEGLRKLQASGVVGLRVQKTGQNEASFMTIQSKLDPALQQESLVVRKLLGLDPLAREFTVEYASVAKDNHELAILSRSMLEILVDLASYIEVPNIHVEEKRVNPTSKGYSGPEGNSPAPLIRIHSSEEKPADAFIAVPYRNYWYWIDDRDLPSKRIFSFLMFMFALVEPGGKGGAPIVTIPAG